MGLNGAAFAATTAKVALTARGGGAPVSPASLALVPSAALQKRDAAAPTASGVGSSTTETDSGGMAGPPGTGAPTPPGGSTSREAGSGSGAGQADESETGASWESRQISPRPRNNVAAHDPMDHWGNRQTGAVTVRLSEIGDTASVLAGFRRLLDAARAANPEWSAPDIEDDDTVAILSQPDRTPDGLAVLPCAGRPGLTSPERAVGFSVATGERTRVRDVIRPFLAPGSGGGRYCRRAASKLDGLEKGEDSCRLHGRTRCQTTGDAQRR